MSGSVPLLFKSLAGELSLDLTNVSARLYDSQNKLLYLGTETGEIFSLQISTKQESIGCTIKSFLTCSLESQSSTNRVLVMTLGEIPFHQLTDSSPIGLISIHADGRIRLWDPKDARCLLCSSAGTIEAPENLLSLEATSSSTRRFVFAIDNTGQCTFIDLWGLKVHKIKESAKIPAVGSLAEEQTIFVIDQDEKIRVYELVGLQSKMLLEYENFLANPDEMDLVIAGHRTLPAQNAYLPVRQSQILATDNSLSIAAFSDPPTDFLLSPDLVAVVYKSKLVVYLRQQVLLLGKLQPFETVRASANEFKTVIWEWEGLDKPLVKGCWLRDGSILMVTDQLQTVVVSSSDLNQLLACDHSKSLNIYTPMLKATKMRDSSVVSVIQKVVPKNLLGPGEKLPAPVTSKQMFTDSQDELLCVMLGSANRLQIYRIESPPGGLGPVFLLDEESGNLSPSKPSQMSLCESVLAAKFGFGKRNPANVADSLMKAISNPVNKLLTEEGLNRLLEHALTGSETVTASCMAVLKDGDVCMLLGTSQGGILIIPAFMVPHGELDMFWIQAEGSVQSIEVQNYMVLASCTNELVTIKFKKDDAGHRELARLQSKKEKSIVLREVASSQITRLQVSSHIERMLSLIVLNQGETWPGSTPDPIITQFCNNTVGVCLQGGQLALLDLAKAAVIFEHRCSQATPVGIFFDKRGEYLLMLFADGQIDVFSVAVGNISMISALNTKIKDNISTPESTRLAFEIKLLLADSFTYERTIWVEEMGLVGLSGRKLLEDYRETYAELKAFSGFSSNQLVNVTQAGIVFQFATQAYTDELTLTHINYAALRTQNRGLRPTPLELERLRASLEKAKQIEEVGFNGMTSLKDLEGYFGNGTEPGAKPPPLNLEQLPQKFQNLLERNWFALARERLGDLPVKLLERIEYDEQRLGNGNQGLTSEDRLQLVRILVSLHYSHRKAFSDPSDDSNLPILKKRYAGHRLWILCYQPPIFDPNSASRQNKLATIFLPQGVDLQSELELKAALGEPTPVFEYALGNQGLAESFGFLLPEGFVAVESLMKSASPPLRRITRVANPLAISKSMTTTILLSIVSELIFVLKKCYPKVPSLVASIRALFFERQDIGTTTFVAPSHLQLILSTLNDKLLLSASAHFALNNILDPKNVSGSSLSDPVLLKSLNYCWDSIKKNKNYSESDPLGVLDGVSKFELFIISCILFQSKISSAATALTAAPREEIVAKLAPVLE